MPFLRRIHTLWSRYFLFPFAILIFGLAAGLAQDQGTDSTGKQAGPAAKPPESSTQTPTDQPPASEAISPGRPAPEPLAADNDRAPDPTLRLGVGDLLEVGVYNVPELSSKTRIGSAGDVYLPLIDYVHLAGLTLEEAQGLLEKKLSDGGFVKNPHVTVFVSEYTSQGASVLGEVGRPGVYPVLGNRRLFDLISAAGGFTEKAGRSVSVTHRSQPDKPVVVPVARNLMDQPESNIEVYPGDTVIVRKADIVYVVGEVGRPSGLLMDTPNLTVLKAIALAGGPTRSAKLDGATIVRKGPNGTTEIPIALKKMLQAKAPDQPMLPEDILFVPTNTGRIVAGKVAQVAMQAAISAALVAAIP